MMAGKVCSTSQPSTGTEATYPDIVTGQSQFLSTPVIAKPLNFGNLSLNDTDYGDDITKGPKDSDTRLMEMIAAQAAHQEGPAFENEEEIANDETLSHSEKADKLQKALNMAASNGDVDRIKRLLNGKARTFLDINAEDEDGTPPLIYASCFVSFNSDPHCSVKALIDRTGS